MPGRSTKPKSFGVCIENKGFDASLETRKIYRILRDDEAEASGMVRVIDESAEDYLYPASWFAPIQLSGELLTALTAAR